MLNILHTPVYAYCSSRLRRTSRNRKALADIPPTLFPYWKSTAHLEFDGIPRNSFFFAVAADALLTFFACVQRSSKACALPSKAADSVWHAWLRMSPASLDDFCETHFDRKIPHLEAPAMPVPMDVGLANCLVEARTLEGINPEGPALPKLFAADRRLRMPDGFAYTVVRGVIECAPMDRSGIPRFPGIPQSSLAPAALLAAGLIGQQEFARVDELMQERQRSDNSGCGTTGSSCGSVSCDGGSGSGGGDGGGGGGCGGGCGGS